jgi:hypothetical protein
MLRPLTDLPDTVIGFEAVGEVHADDYRDVLRPAIEAACADGGKVRLVYVLGPEFHGYSIGAGWQDTKMGTHHLTAFERTAVVTDVEWVEHLVGGFSWMVPGELRRFPLADLAPAVQWAAGQEATNDVVAEAAPDAAADLAAIPGQSQPFEAAPEADPAPEPVAAVPVAVDPEPEPEPVAEATTAETPAAAVAPAAAFGGQETITPRAPMAPGADMRPGMAQPAPPTAPQVPAQWAPDPSGRHHHRWWDGNQWTGHVADNGVSSFDPI